MDFFYDKKCKIYSISNALVKGSQKKTESTLYDMIPCDFWKSSAGNSIDTPLSRETIENKYTLNLLGGYTGILKGYLVDLYNVVSGTNIIVGTFVVSETPEYFSDLNGNINNIQIKLKDRDI